ncbi:uncharacterized protein MYCGRDRAFT_94725 [Zymoseptoria tritici IPO323]|uniref:Uncharacterized protein n=1 Tax=Zymoseptoria tritici (strain CBS 115943 / IPO323) TaxID=336722 RepID=F9XEU1_ZYMTI|nr:uncharacterized protein MYCGRDRAFT_94725 [Zymoseptoria tritici IPO323]EGP85829.1 hypothetical protein MYCGRDRAFT_94725 [Zymoseptoria tritici IPO323]
MKKIPGQSIPFSRAASKEPANTVTQISLVNLSNTCCNNIIFQPIMSGPAFVIPLHPDPQEFAKYIDAWGNITHRQQDATEVYTRAILPCLQQYMDGLKFQTTTYLEYLECGDTSEISLMQKLYESQTETETIEIDCETCEVRTTHSMAERIGRISGSAPANDLVIRAGLQEWTTEGAVKTKARMPVHDGLMAVTRLGTPMRAVNICQHKGPDVNSGHYVCYRRPALADLARESLIKRWPGSRGCDPKAQYINVLLAPITTADIIVLARLATAKFHADTVAAIEADLSLSDGKTAEALTRSPVRSALAGKDLTPEEFCSSFIGGGELAQAMDRLVDDGISCFENAKYGEHQAAWRAANDPNTMPPMAAPQRTQESEQIISSPVLSIRQWGSVPMSGKSARRDMTPCHIVDMLAGFQGEKEQRSDRKDKSIVRKGEEIIKAELAGGDDILEDDDFFEYLGDTFAREAEADGGSASN